MDCCCEKTTERSAEEQKLLLNRLNRIEGQIRGIKGMVERNIYCADIITQVAAVSAALASFNRELLAAHINTCVTNDIKEGNAEKTDELILLLGKLIK